MCSAPPYFFQRNRAWALREALRELSAAGGFVLVLQCFWRSSGELAESSRRARGELAECPGPGVTQNAIFNGSFCMGRGELAESLRRGRGRPIIEQM